MRLCYFGIYNPEFSRNRTYMRALRAEGHEIVECRDTTRGLLKYFRLATKLRSLRGSYDAIVVGYPGHIVVPIARMFGSAPVVADLLGSLSDAARQSHGAGLIRRIWLALVDRLAIASADAVLVESESQKEYLKARFGGEKYRVVYTGADEEVFGARHEKITSAANPFIILFRGRLTPESGIMHILDVAESLRKDARFSFRIVGYGRLLEAVKARVASLPNVQLISDHLSFEEMRRHMLDADVSLGQFEDNERLDRTIPHKAFESMAMGIPYLTAHARGVSEILEDDVSALMVPVKNPEAIKDALVRLCEDRALGVRLAQKARVAFEARASGGVVARKIIAAIDEAKMRVSSVAASYIPFGRREVLVLSLLLTLFVVIRLPGLSLPYHQDESKTAHIVRMNIVGALSAHPPLTELIYRKGGEIVGSDHLRVIPLVFGVISAWLLYLVVRGRSGIRAAMCALALYATCMYAVWASLMADTDGAILPTFFLLAVLGYDRFRDARGGRGRAKWLGLIVLGLLLGFLTKLSYVLAFGALSLDYLIEMRQRLTRSFMLRAALAILACGALAVLAIVSAHLFISAFHPGETIAHALYYMRFSGRGYLQTMIQAMKAIFFLSPLLLAPLVFVSKDDFKRNRIFAMYLGLGFIFYFILFDFSQGALDKYLMYSIVPLCAFAGTIFERLLRGSAPRSIVFGFVLGGVFAAGIVALAFLSPQALPLYPKTEWISAVRHGNWNILMPFTGGSGPLGFYVSFLFIAAGFVVSGVTVLAARMFRPLRSVLLVALIIVGLAYNAVFIEELLWGRINGSAPVALAQSIAYIRASSDITSVVTQADIGAYELDVMGKYGGRFYAVPGNEDVHRERFAEHTGHYLVVDFPLLNPESFYSKFFATCASVFETNSGVIESHVYYCPTSDPYSIH